MTMENASWSEEHCLASDVWANREELHAHEPGGEAGGMA